LIFVTVFRIEMSGLSSLFKRNYGTHVIKDFRSYLDSVPVQSVVDTLIGYNLKDNVKTTFES
jgi:hypothetical protein